MKNYLSFLFIQISFIFVLTTLTSCNNPTENPESNKEQIEMGEKLVLEAKCGFCHTPYIETADTDKPETLKLFSGHPEDYKFPELPKVPTGSQQWLEFVENLENTVWLNNDMIVFSANITPHKETGIGTWTKEMFIKTIRTGKHPETNKNLKQPMPWNEYSELSDEQITAVFAYLMNLKPVENKVPGPLPIK